MNLSWITLHNPVALWWLFLVSASIINIIAWTWTRLYLYKNVSIVNFRFNKLIPENLIWFSALYVFVCAYRSVFTKADVQRICLFDTWLSSVFLGRSLATIGELAFIAQWAIVIRYLAIATDEKKVERLSYYIVPIILLAECFSWFAVTTTNYLGNSIEESLWTVAYILIAYSLAKLWLKFKDAFKYAIGISIIFNVLYILFMLFVDVHMYITRLIQDTKDQKKYFGLIDGMIDLNIRWIVTYNINDWKTEIPWMSLYFSFAVLVSVGLCFVPLSKNKLHKHFK